MRADSDSDFLNVTAQKMSRRLNRRDPFQPKCNPLPHVPLSDLLLNDSLSVIRALMPDSTQILSLQILFETHAENILVWCASCFRISQNQSSTCSWRLNSICALLLGFPHHFSFYTSFLWICGYLNPYLLSGEKSDCDSVHSVCNNALLPLCTLLTWFCWNPLRHAAVVPYP